MNVAAAQAVSQAEITLERLLAKGADVAPEILDGFSALDLAGTVECLALLHPRRRARSSA